MGNPFGRSVVLPLTNQSGGSVAAGDFVYLDTAHNDSFTTGTTGAYTGAIGVAQQAIGSGSVGLVLVSGYASLVNVNASVTRGHYGAGHTVVKQATDAGASRIAGTFCQFLTGGTTPDAMVWQPDLGGASGSVATDAIWDAAGDLAVGSGADTAVKLTKGSAGGVLAMSNGAVTWNAGSSFPGSPATNDRYFRTDLGMEFYYDGTRWVSSTLYHLPLSVNEQLVPISTTGQTIGRAAGWNADFDLWLVKYYAVTFVNTTNDGSHYWTLTLYKQGGSTTTNIDATITTASDTASQWTKHTITIGALIGNGTTFELGVKGDKTSTPGTLYVVSAVTYRVVAT